MNTRTELNAMEQLMKEYDEARKLYNTSPSILTGSRMQELKRMLERLKRDIELGKDPPTFEN